VISLLEALRHDVEYLDWCEDALRVTLSGGVAVSKKGISTKEHYKCSRHSGLQN
jgi:GGDEF domain-containing protein